MERVFNDIKAGLMTLDEFKAWAATQREVGYENGYMQSQLDAAELMAGEDL